MSSARPSPICDETRGQSLCLISSLGAPLNRPPQGATLGRLSQRGTVLKTPVKAADADTHEDIMRTVQFAKDIDASKLQPAILTPFPGTPVY